MLGDMICKLFAQNLKELVLRWFCNLLPESIDSFDELSLEFMRSYAVHIQSKKIMKDLWGLVQWPNETLRAYIRRFSKAIYEISGLNDGTAREALKKGLRHMSLFKNEICAKYRPTIQSRHAPSQEIYWLEKRKWTCRTRISMNQRGGDKSSWGARGKNDKAWTYADAPPQRVPWWPIIEVRAKSPIITTQV